MDAYFPGAEGGLWHEWQSQLGPSQARRPWTNYCLSDHRCLTCKRRTIKYYSHECAKIVWKGWSMFSWNCRSSSFWPRTFCSNFYRHLMAKVRLSFIGRVEAFGSEESDWDSTGQMYSMDRSEERCPWLSGELGRGVRTKFTTLGALSCLRKNKCGIWVSVSVYVFFLGKCWFFLLDHWTC